MAAVLADAMAAHATSGLGSTLGQWQAWRSFGSPVAALTNLLKLYSRCRRSEDRASAADSFATLGASEFGRLSALARGRRAVESSLAGARACLFGLVPSCPHDPVCPSCTLPAATAFDLLALLSMESEASSLLFLAAGGLAVAGAAQRIAAHANADGRQLGLQAAVMACLVAVLFGAVTPLHNLGPAACHGATPARARPRCLSPHTLNSPAFRFLTRSCTGAPLARPSNAPLPPTPPSPSRRPWPGRSSALPWTRRWPSQTTGRFA